MVGLYRGRGLGIYERVHYSRGEHRAEVDELLRWHRAEGSRMLDVGCSGGLHALELARRGARVTGIDVEASAVRLAGARARREALAAEFRTLDVDRDDLSTLGRFDFVYSIGNVLSHVPKERFPAVLSKLAALLAPGAPLVFDVLLLSEPFAPEVWEQATRILWRRRLDPGSGAIALEGEFVEAGRKERFEVWGHTRDEVFATLRKVGLGGAECSRGLDFARPAGPDETPMCLYFRARTRRAT